MDKSQIIKSISDISGIKELNDMQVRMLDSTADSILLTAPTGSGKTLAFATRILRNLSEKSQKPQAIVIAPSRELVIQTYNVIRPLAKGYKSVALYGGHSMIDEKNSLTPIPDLIIATPGRLLDHLQRGNIVINRLATLVLDEFDKILDLGFESEMRRIMSRIKSVKTFILTSATVIDPLPDFIPTTSSLHINHSSASAPRERMQTVEVESFSRDKLDSLVNLLRSIGAGERTIVFVNHRESAERVIERLKKEHIPATLYHGALDQQQRALALDLFANGTTPVLVATDLAARGLDIDGVANIIHYHLPVDQPAWIHRNGRTARVDRTGTIYVITSEADNRPGYITFDRKYIPDATETEFTDMQPSAATLYFNAGKKEKISKGDIAGFISASGAVLPNEIGKINIYDHYSIAAVPPQKVQAAAKALNSLKLKGKKVRVSIVRP